MKKLIISMLAVLFTAFTVHAADFGGTYKQASKGRSNQPAYWGENAWKVEATGNSLGKCFVADAHYDMVVIKSGTKDDVWVNVRPGDVLCTSDGKGISHIIFVPATEEEQEEEQEEQEFS